MKARLLSRLGLSCSGILCSFAYPTRSTSMVVLYYLFLMCRHRETCRVLNMTLRVPATLRVDTRKDMLYNAHPLTPKTTAGGLAMAIVTQTTVLKTAIATYPHTKGLKDGTVTAPGIEFEHIEITPIIAAFRRMCRRLEFDVAEMAITT